MEIWQKVMEVIWTFASILIIPTLLFGIHYFLKTPVARYPDNGWMKVEEYPLPDDIKEYLGTDGNEVRTMYGINWGPHGKIIFSEYNKTYLKYWQPFPLPPNK